MLVFWRKHLLYDIRNIAYVEGHILETDNEHLRHTIQDVGEVGNVDRVTRMLDLAHAKCKELLHPYTKHKVYRPLENELRERKVYGIILSLPQDFSQTTLDLLERLIHEYMVNRAVADWMSITNQAKVETWAAKAAAMEGEIRSCMNTRMSRVRIRTHPF